MTRYNSIFILALSLVSLAACHKKEPTPKPQPIDELCYSQEPTYGFISLSGPGNAKAGQPVAFPVVVTGKDGCAYQAHTTATIQGNILQLQSMVDYQGCFCTEAIEAVKDTLVVTFPQPGTYILQAPDGNGGTRTHMVAVQ